MARIQPGDRVRIRFRNVCNWPEEIAAEFGGRMFEVKAVSESGMAVFDYPDDLADMIVAHNDRRYGPDRIGRPDEFCIHVGQLTEAKEDV